MRRVVVTGVGIVSPVGKTTREFWSAVIAGHCGIAPVEQITKDGLTIKIGAEVKDYDPADHFGRSQLALLDRHAQFAVIAAREAVADAGIAFDPPLALRTATIIGSGVGGQNTQDDNYWRLYGEQAKRLHPFTIPRLMFHSATSHVTMDLGLTGPAFTVASACASATHAIGQAAAMVRSGQVEVAVTGGAESCITFGTMKGWEALRVMAPDTCRPFSRNRRGMVLGEGAAVFILEPLERAQARGAGIHAELAGFGMSADAGDIVEPSADGAARAIAGALADAGLAPEDVDYVNAHGTGTQLNDVTETKALHEVFGGHAKRLAVSSTKSMHGHALGAAGAIEMVATVLAVRDGKVPPTLNLTEPDPDCDLDYVPDEGRDLSVRAALCDSFAFGGLNAVLAVRRFDG